MAVIEFSSLSKEYKGKRGVRVQALSDLSLTIEAGEVFGFLGPNGAGKSTAIKALMGLIQPSEGEAFLCGKPVSAPESRMSVGYLPENPAFYDFLTAQEYLAFVGKSFGMDQGGIERRSAEVLGVMELADAANRPIRTYSKGMVQRLGLAQAMLHDPEVYILDEPMSGLDPLGRAMVKQIIRELKNAGKTVFFSTHITSDVEAVCDRVGIIVGGCLRSLESVEELMRQGIEGYLVRARNCPEEILDRFHCSADYGEVKEFRVSSEDMKDVLAKIVSSGGELELIEPARRDIETFFLEIVARGR